MISVGIDVAKRTHEACFMDAQGQEIGRPLRFPNTAGGVATLSDRLRGLEQPVSIALEATGHYWLALHERWTREGFQIQVVNPIQTDAYRRTTVRKATATTEELRTDAVGTLKASMSFLTRRLFLTAIGGDDKSCPECKQELSEAIEQPAPKHVKIIYKLRPLVHPKVRGLPHPLMILGAEEIARR